MRLTETSDLAEVASQVAAALAEAGIRAVLTGGACASLLTDGAYMSSDLDFVIQGESRTSDIDAAMASVEFVREGGRYVHPHAPFFVEFLPGPLAIGSDHQIRPVEFRIESTVLLALSATDSCRDRLAAFYYWYDRQSLRTAVEIALRHKVNHRAIREWSLREQRARELDEFRHEVRRGRAVRRREQLRSK